MLTPATQRDSSMLEIADRLNPGVNCWVVDTGSGQHLVARSKLTDQEADDLPHGEVMRMMTANGQIKDDVATDTTIRSLDNLKVEDVRVLKSTPRVLSVYKLVKEGAKLAWDQDGVRLTFNGVTHELPIKSGVPLLALPSVLQHTSGETGKRRRNNRRRPKIVSTMVTTDDLQSGQK